MDNHPPAKKGSLCMAPMRREPCASGAGRTRGLRRPEGNDPAPLKTVARHPEPHRNRPQLPWKEVRVPQLIGVLKWRAVDEQHVTETRSSRLP